MDTFVEVQTWLRNNYNIGVSAEWLSACLEWIQQENQSLLPMNELLSQVYQQWLLSDLSEIGEPVLPQNIESTDRYELVSNYPLQLLSLIDVGFPLYGQKQKLQGRMNPNEDVSADKPFQPAWEPKPSRMLLLQLTDGHTQVQAMEYRQIKDLHPMLPSGLKLLVMGTVLCRRGMIMLTPECLQVLGGEVDALAEQNTPLANLENAMIRNREDEGRHAKKEFSGAFVCRGVDKKLDNSQKPVVARFNQSNHQATEAKFDSSKVKMNDHKPGIAQHGWVDLKLDTGQVIPKKQEQLHLKQESDQWGDEMNYDDCFEDDLDLEEINAIDFSSATDMEEETSVKSSLNSVLPQSHSTEHMCNPWGKDQSGDSLLKLEIVGDTNKIVGMNRVAEHTAPQQLGGLPNVLNNDAELFDEDFDIDELTYPAIPNAAHNKGHKLSAAALSTKVEQTCNLTNEQIAFMNKSQQSKLPSKSATSLYHRNFTMSSSPHKQHHSTDSSCTDSSPSIPFQDLQSTNTSIKPRISSTSAVSSNRAQSVPTRKSKLFKTKSGPQGISVNCGSISRSQATRQCKLTDMFRAPPCGLQGKQTSFDGDGCSIFGDVPLSHSELESFADDCSIINDDITAHSSEMLIQKSIPVQCSNSLSSKLGDTTSDRAFRSCKDNSIVSNCTIRTAQYTDPKMEYELHEEDNTNSLPKAVIYPFSSSNDCSDSLDTANSLPYQYLSELASMQPPASITVKAYISTLIDKLGSNGGACWSLACRINDGTACLDVDLADSVLTELIGFSAQDSVIMRQKIKTEPRVKHILTEGLSKCQHKLINISCLMEVNAVSVARKPVIKRLILMSGQHVNELIKRVQRYLPY